MDICTNLDTIAVIDLDECIGVSLNTININYQLLQENICDTNDELLTVKNTLQELNTSVVQLSSQILKSARAYVAFNGATTPPTIISSYNVISVSALSAGSYSINFTRPFSDSNYALIGNVSESHNQNNYGWLHATTDMTSASAVINIHSSLSGQPIAPEYVTVTIFNDK